MVIWCAVPVVDLAISKSDQIIQGKYSIVWKGLGDLGRSNSEVATAYCSKISVNYRYSKLGMLELLRGSINLCVFFRFRLLVTSVLTWVLNLCVNQLEGGLMLRWRLGFSFQSCFDRFPGKLI